MIHDAIIIGGGHNGLVCGCLLAKAGLDVVLLEARPMLGGATVTEQLVPGFQFSTCAFHTFLVHETVVRAAGADRWWPKMLDYGPRTCLLPDDEVFQFAIEPEVTARRALAAFGEHDAGACLRWEQEWDAIAKLVDRFLLGPAPDLAQLGQAAFGMGAAHTFNRFLQMSMSELLDGTFQTPRARAIFAPTIDGRASTPGIALAHAYFRTGRYRDTRYQGVPEGGMGSVARAFALAATDSGVSLRTSTPVVMIDVDDGVVTGVETADGDRIRARAVVSNADPKRTLLMVRPSEFPSPPRELASMLDTSRGAIRAHFALSGPPDVRSVLGVSDETKLGSVLVYPVLSWYEAMGIECDAGAWPDSTVVEIQMPTFADPTLAAPGMHCLSVYVPHVAPRLANAHWRDMRGRVEEWILGSVARAIPNIDSTVVGSAIFLPPDLDEHARLTDGAIYHLTHTLKHSFSDRGLPSQRDGRTPIRNLYLCGAGTHPGGGVSGMPGFNAARLILTELGLSSQLAVLTDASQ